MNTMRLIPRTIAIFLAILMATPISTTLSAAPVDPDAPAAPAGAAASAPGQKAPMIEVSVDSLEITESNSTEIGVNWGQAVSREDNQLIPTLQYNRLNFGEIGRTVSPIFSLESFERATLQAQLKALISNGQARILANPTLMTKSGFEATFLVGGEVPYPTPAPVGQAPGVEFKKYGVALKILPMITPRNTVEAQINVGVTNIDEGRPVSVAGTTVFGLLTRESSSKVEVADGDTVVLAGIKQSSRSKVVTKIPILGSIPLLGLLFRSKEERVTQTSIVQFVTFRIIK